jgi:hypothetical protein
VKLLKNLIALIGLLFFLTSCSTAPYFVSFGKDDLGFNRVEDLYGQGEYFYFFSRYTMTKEEVSSDYELYFEFVENEVQAKNVCEKSYSIVKKSLSYYGENGSVSVLIRCNSPDLT